MARAYVSIGSNIDREHNIRSSVRTLRSQFKGFIASKVYESGSVGFAGPPFYNLVVSFETSLPPYGLDQRLHEIEDAHGRDRAAPKFSGRTLDLDLILYDDLVLEELRLPRDEVTRYAFVLGPLAEIAGNLRHPQTGERIADLWAQFNASKQPLSEVDIQLE